MSHMTPEEKILNLIKKAQGNLKLKKELRIFTKINILLISIIAVVSVIFLMDVIKSKKNISELKTGLARLDTETMPEEPDNLKQDEKTETQEEVPVPEPSAPVEKIDPTENLNLLGIITGSSNQAIIEDKKLNKTFFLYEGDTVGEFKIFSISDTGVTLEHKGQRIELKM